MRPLIIGLILVCATNAAAKTRDQQTECGVDALKAFTAQKLELLQRGGGEYALTVGGVIAQRRLAENYCQALADCIRTPALGFGAVFAKCLRDEEATDREDDPR